MRAMVETLGKSKPFYKNCGAQIEKANLISVKIKRT